MTWVAARSAVRGAVAGDRPLWFGFVGLQVLFLALLAVLPGAGLPPVVEAGSQALSGLSASAAILVGVARYRPASPAPWYLLALAMASTAAGMTWFYVDNTVLGDPSFPTPADFFYLAVYVFSSVAVVLFVRRRTPDWDLVATVDAGILAVGAALMSWVFLISPAAFGGDASLLTRAVVGAYPMLDLLLLALVVRLMLGAGVRTKAFWLATGSVLLFLAADIGYSVQSLMGIVKPGIHLEVTWAAGVCMLGVAALHPSMRQIDERSATVAPSAGAGRLVLLAAASLAAPAVLAVQYARGVDPQIPVVVGACVTLFLLVMIRMAGLVRAQRRVAITDALTGLRTRRYFEETIGTETARALRSGNPLGLLILDVDHFKRVNDSYGHHGGDRVLVEVAARLRACVRAGDVVARYGGEEFAVVLPDTGELEMIKVGEKIRIILAGTPIAVNDKTLISVSVSVGAATLPTHGRTRDELVQVADRALYAAKQGGRNRLAVGATEPQEQQLAEASRLTLIDYLEALAAEVDTRIAPFEHGPAVGRWAAAVAEEMGLDADAQRRCALAGTLHDIGKITVPEAVLRKPGRLSMAEWRLLKTHPDQGARLLRLDPGLADVARIVRQHHERYDGSGYPDGRVGADTTIEARILSACDAWAAMRVDRPYQPAKTIDEATAELRQWAGTQFDPVVVDAFIAVLHAGQIDELPEVGAGRP